MVFARAPLSAATPVVGATAAFRVRVAGTPALTVIAAHAAQPLTQPMAWIRDGRSLADAVRTVRGPVVLVGDLNATDDHLLVRRLVAAGLRDAAELANSGWQPTWPSAGLPVLHSGGLGALDHVLVGGGVGAVSTTTEVIPGSDHRMLAARLVTGSVGGADG
jgi:endonuclease/exonuclease/phosphatase (EEP) superfamily protein YafD